MCDDGAWRSIGSLVDELLDQARSGRYSDNGVSRLACYPSQEAEAPLVSIPTTGLNCELVASRIAVSEAGGMHSPEERGRYLPCPARPSASLRILVIVIGPAADLRREASGRYRSARGRRVSPELELVAGVRFGPAHRHAVGPPEFKADRSEFEPANFPCRLGKRPGQREVAEPGQLTCVIANQGPGGLTHTTESAVARIGIAMPPRG